MLKEKYIRARDNSDRSGHKFRCFCLNTIVIEQGYELRWNKSYKYLGEESYK